MNLKQLEAFVGVVESRSFSKAAKELFLTQPTISAHISSLEKELNAKLLIRNTKEVNPSEKGRSLYQYARQMVDLQKGIYREFCCADEAGRSVITLAASTIPAQYILPQVLPEFYALYPQEQFRILESDSADVVEKVNNNEAEVGLTGTRIDSPYCEYEPFYRDRLVIITPNREKYRAFGPGPLRPEQLAREAFIMREEGSGTRKEAESYLEKLGVLPGELNIIASISNQEAIKKSVSNGMGISIMSATAAADYEAEGRILCFNLLEGGTFRNLNIVKNKTFKRSAGADKFIRFVREFFERESKKEEETNQ